MKVVELHITERILTTLRKKRAKRSLSVMHCLVKKFSLRLRIRQNGLKRQTVKKCWLTVLWIGLNLPVHTIRFVVDAACSMSVRMNRSA